MSQDQFSIPGGLFNHPNLSTTSQVAGPSLRPDIPPGPMPGHPNQPSWIRSPVAGPSSRPADDPFWLGKPRPKPVRPIQPSRIPSPVAGPSTLPDLPLKLREPGPMPVRPNQPSRISPRPYQPPSELFWFSEKRTKLNLGPKRKPWLPLPPFKTPPPPQRVLATVKRPTPPPKKPHQDPEILKEIARRDIFSPLNSPPPPQRPRTPPPKPPVLSPASLARLPEYPARVLRYQALLPKYEPVIPRPKPLPRRPLGPVQSPPEGGFPKLVGPRRTSSPRPWRFGDPEEKVEAPVSIKQSELYARSFDEPYDFSSSSSEDAFTPYDKTSEYKLSPNTWRKYRKDLEKWQDRRIASPRLLMRKPKLRYIPNPPRPPTPLPPTPLSPPRSPALEEMRRKMIESEDEAKYEEFLIMSVPIVEDYPRLMENLSCLIRLYAPAVQTESLKPRDHIVLVDLILRTLTERKNNENLRLPQLQNQLADTVVRHFGFRISSIINEYKTECENVQRQIAEKKAYIKATVPKNEKLKKEVEEVSVTLDMYENTDREERIKQQLYAKEPHFNRCFSKREHMRLLAENAPLQKKVDDINRRLLEVEEQCMKDIVNESQWIDIFPPGFESSLLKLLPRINVWNIPRQHFNDLAGRLAEILKRIHIKRSEDWIALQNFINDMNPQITLLMQDVEERKQYLDDIEAETTKMRMRNHKLRDDIDIRRRECSDYELGTQFYKDREAEVMHRIQSATQATLDLEEEMAEFLTPKTPTPVVVPRVVTPIPVSQPATGSGVFNLSPEVAEAALSERSRTPHSRDDSLGLLDAKQVTRFEDRLGLSRSIDASRSINLPEREASPIPVATQRSPSPNWLDDSLELLHYTRAPSVMEDRLSLLGSTSASPESLHLTERVASPVPVATQRSPSPNLLNDSLELLHDTRAPSVMDRLSLSGSIGAYSDSLDSPERVASPVAVASQTIRLREDSPGMLDATRPPTGFEDSLNLSRDLYLSPDSLQTPKRVPPEVLIDNHLLGGPPNEFYSIPQQSETISLSPFAPTEVRSVKTPTGSVKSLIKFSSPGRSVPFNMELEMKPQGIRQSPSGHRVICDVALEMKEAEDPQPRWRNIHFLKHIVRGSPPISETIGRRFDRKHGLFTPRSVIRRDFIGVRRPLFGDFPWVTGRTPPRTPSPLPPPLATTIEWEGTPKE